MLTFLSRHGDIVYVSYVEPQEPGQAESTESAAQVNNVKQDEVDDFLEKQRGLIHRKKDPKL